MTTTIETVTINPSLNKRLEDIRAKVSSKYTIKHLLATGDNVQTIVDYLTAMNTEINYSPSYGIATIGTLYRFSKYHKNKPFKDITRDDIINYLNSLRKTDTQDPLHQWIASYNHYMIILLRFFKWYYSPNLHHAKRPTPAVMENIDKLKRDEVSIYKPSDMWSQSDDLLFLTYCPSKRDKCYHAISRDSSARPHEITKLKVGDVAFKRIGNSQYAEVVVSGKTGTRNILLIDSIPYLKDYISNEHPQPGNLNAPLICGEGKRLGQHITPQRLHQIYDKYKTEIFPKLLESPNVLPEHKPLIKELLNKRWNPYVRRHSALTAKARILKEPILKIHAGWSQSSQMHLKYEHWFGDEGNVDLLEAHGLVDHGTQVDQLRPKQCPQCNEPNKVDSRFCNKCRMVLNYDAYNETLEEQRRKELEVQSLKEKYELDMKSMREDMNKQFSQVMEMIQENPKLAKVKPEVLARKKSKMS